ncbi:unnamed protein product [Paramecium pentaurelia]|uniref:t-SNARE coiled-coil homology domain-containing protein n=1 Tax=Paramecium pentaurelia TaxID=43138 RepID=A0A8S1UX64_9CILI|nr:unnamed protein product [Paramecium pentaurelia]
MSFLQEFNKVKKQQDTFELQDLRKNDGETQITKMTQMAQARILNFEKFYHQLKDEIIDNKSSKGMDDIPTLVTEAKNDLDEMLKIIQQMQSIQLLKSQRIQQNVQKLIQVFQDSNKKLKKLTDQLLSRQRTSLQSAKQSFKDHHNDNQIDVQLLDEILYDEQFIQRWNQQISEMGQVIYQLNQMMTDGAKMIKEQGLKIDIISLEVKNSKQKVKEADKEVKKASQVQQGNNGRMLFFCGIITLLQKL